MINNKSIAAIVPAYNEAERIESVLNTLNNTKTLDEIVVIDDGSKDNTEEIVNKYENIKYLKNEKNQGKAYSMNRGVKSTTSDIIFFCDADLKGLTPEIVEGIISPVANGEKDMFLGIRNNTMQKTVKSVAINTGERALKREIWENLPDFYKHRYRIEAGLNNFVKTVGSGFDYKIFPYYQTLKETKYEISKGMFLRWWMNLDVMTAQVRAKTYDKIRKFK